MENCREIECTLPAGSGSIEPLLVAFGEKDATCASASNGTTTAKAAGGSSRVSDVSPASATAAADAAAAHAAAARSKGGQGAPWRSNKRSTYAESAFASRHSSAHSDQSPGSSRASLQAQIERLCHDFGMHSLQLTRDAHAEAGRRHLSALERALRATARSTQLALHGVSLVLCKSASASVTQCSGQLVLHLPMSVREQVYELELRTVDLQRIHQASRDTQTRSCMVEKAKRQLTSAMKVSHTSVDESVDGNEVERLAADAVHLQKRFDPMLPNEPLQVPIYLHGCNDIAWAEPLSCSRCEYGRVVAGFSRKAKAVLVAQSCSAEALFRFLVKEQATLSQLQVHSSWTMQQIWRLRRGIEQATGTKVTWDALLDNDELEAELRSMWASATSMNNVCPSTRSKANLRGREICIIHGDTSVGAQLAADGSLRIPIGSYAHGFGQLLRWLATLRSSVDIGYSNATTAASAKEQQQQYQRRKSVV